MNVSGIVEYDEKGREARKGQVYFEGSSPGEGGITELLGRSLKMVNATETKYDVKDRVEEV
jgi:hypothetical protein